MDVGFEQGFQSRYIVGMPVEIQFLNKNILMGVKLQQNRGKQNFYPPALNQVFIDVPPINQSSVREFEFESIQGRNQYQNQGGTQM